MSKDAFIAINRFGLGAGVEDTLTISKDPHRWLSSQISQSALQTELRSLSKNMGSFSELADKHQFRKNISVSERKTQLKNSRDTFMKEMERRIQHGTTTKNPFIERLALFWSNHFTVSIKGKPYLAALAGVYEREAIRPYVFGKFSDMLLAVITHPTMLVYLDNHSSFGPNSRIGQKRGRGLNENLAREILELHTLGVNGGYTQDDVIGLAKIITGWSVKPPHLPGKTEFRFIKQIHEPGTHQLLGKAYTQEGQQQGIQALRDLANHPSTARFIATKLARHFIADTPPQSAVNALEKVFLDTGGDLMELSKALIALPEIWHTPLAKFKTPYELIISSFRTLGASSDDIKIKKIAPSFALLDHMPFNANSPAGWSDQEADWLSSNSLMNRIEWVHALSQLIPFKGNPNNLAKIVIGPAANADTMLWISRAPTSKDGLALIMASPAFQRR